MARYTALDVSNFLIQQAIENEEGELLTNMKLQKLLYYAQGCYLAVYGEPLFDENLEAWQMGPVVPDVYHTFKVCGRQPIEAPYNEPIVLDRSVSDFLAAISETFGQFSAFKLMNMTHIERPWQETYVSGMNEVINFSLLTSFFRERWVGEDFDLPEENEGKDFIQKLKEAEREANQAPEYSADEVLEWLDQIVEKQNL